MKCFCGYWIAIFFIARLSSSSAQDTDLKIALSGDNDVSLSGQQSNENAGVVFVDEISPEDLEVLCQNAELTVYVQAEDIAVDCSSFKNGGLLEGPEEERFRPRIIVKRDADQFEGSGDSGGEPGDTTTEDGTKNVETEVTGNVTELKETTTAVVERETTKSSTPEPENSTPAPETEAPEILNPETSYDRNQTIVSNNDGENFDLENSSEKETPLLGKNIESDKPAGVPDQPILELATTEQKKPKGKTLIGKQQVVENSPDDDTKTGSSTVDKASSSKDTTILVVLFVAVLVVGAAAFGYNFIKKRKRAAADVDRLEKGSLKRSLQNLTTKTEPKTEQEMKPLIKDENKEVEMKEMRSANGSSSGEIKNAPDDNRNAQ